MKGLVPAIQIVLYVGLFTLFIAFGSQAFPNIDNTRVGPLMFLTLFCFSVLTCGLIVFYRPYMLFMENKGKEAMKLVVHTTKWLGILAVIIMTSVFLISR